MGSAARLIAPSCARSFTKPSDADGAPPKVCRAPPTVLTEQATEIDVAPIENRGRMAIMSSREEHVSVCCSTKASCCIVIVLNNPRCVWSKWIVCREHLFLCIPLFPSLPFPSHSSHLVFLPFSERRPFVLYRQTDIVYLFSYIYIYTVDRKIEVCIM